MIAHKHITKIIAAGMAAAVCLCLCTVAFSGPIAAAAGETGITMAYETALFDTSSVLEVNIRMDEADWNDMLANAAAEEYYQCDVEIGGTTFYRVAIRPKGNTSLTSIASDPTTDRYSFKLEFDHYVDGQTCFGLDKLILNNSYADATNMKEALIYDMYQYLGADASLYNYAKLSVNGESIMVRSASLSKFTLVRVANKPSTITAAVESLTTCSLPSVARAKPISAPVSLS